MSHFEARARAAGVIIPDAAVAVANYLPWVICGSTLHVSGQLSISPARRILGTVGAELNIEAGREAARLAGINLLGQFKAACGGDLDRLVRVVRIGVFVQASATLAEIPAVANGVSDLLVEVLGDAGRHARSAVGAHRLPLNAAVEVDAVAEIRGT